MHLVTDMGIGGVEKFVYQLVERYDRKQFDMFIVTIFPAEQSELEEKLSNMGVRIIHLGFKYKNAPFGTMLKLVLLLRKEKPDIVNLHTYVMQMELFSMLMYRKCKYVHTVHIPAEAELRACSRWIAKLEYKKLGLIPVAVSKYVEKTVLDLYNLKSCKVIYNGIDLEEFATLKRPDKQNEIIEVLTVARFVPEKNHDTIIRAFKRVCTKVDNVILKLAGDGKLMEPMKQLVKELEIEERVKFLGNRNDIPELLNSSDIFLLGSKFEGFGLVLVEAMASALPVIATNVGAVSEIVKDRETGILIEPNEDEMEEAILQLISNKTLRDYYGKKGRAQALQFGLDSTVRQYEELFLSLNE